MPCPLLPPVSGDRGFSHAAHTHPCVAPCGANKISRAYFCCGRGSGGGCDGAVAFFLCAGSQSSGGKVMRQKSGEASPNSSPTCTLPLSRCPKKATVQGSSSAVLAFTSETCCPRFTGVAIRIRHPLAFTVTVCVCSSKKSFPGFPRTSTGIIICTRCVRRRDSYVSPVVPGLEGFISAMNISSSFTGRTQNSIHWMRCRLALHSLLHATVQQSQFTLSVTGFASEGVHNETIVISGQRFSALVDSCRARFGLLRRRGLGSAACAGCSGRPGFERPGSAADATDSFEAQ